MLIIAAGLFLILPVGAVLAQDTEAVTTTLQVENPDTGEREPVEGVSLTVTDADGNEIGTGTTDAEGVFLLEVPEPGSYQILLDDSTLPEGIVLNTPDRNPATVRVEAGQTRATIFALTSGEAGAAGGSSGVTARQVLQLTVEGIKFGLFIAMAAIGLSLIFGTTGLVNFAHGEMVGWGMLMAYFFNFYGLAGMFGWMDGWPAPFGAGVNVIFATGIAIILGGALGWLLDAGIFSQLRAAGYRAHLADGGHHRPVPRPPLHIPVRIRREARVSSPSTPPSRRSTSGPSTSPPRTSPSAPCRSSSWWRSGCSW